MAKVQQKHGGPFDRLPDEVVLKILYKACEVKMARWWRLPTTADSDRWVSALLLPKLSLVCQRFNQLNALAGASNVLWEFEKADVLRGVFVASHVGKHLHGLGLHYSRVHRAEMRKLQAVPSVEFLAAILEQTPNLHTFALIGNATSQTLKASEYLLRLLGKLPLKTLSLVDLGFSFAEPLKSFCNWRNMKECRIQDASISDLSLQSLLGQLPALEKLHVNFCKGLEQPTLRSSSLRKLVLFASASSGKMVIEAPNLLSLKGVLELDRLEIYSPLLKRISLSGPVNDIEALHNCKFTPSKLEISGRAWRVQNIQKLLNTFGPSEKLILEMDDFHNDSEPCGVSTFLGDILPSISSLEMGDMCAQLKESVTCKKVLQRIRFKLLKRIQVTVTQGKDFTLIPLLMGCCPNLQQIDISMRYLQKPIDLLATRVTRLQRAFPKVEIGYEEPAQFLSSSHVEDIAMEEHPEEALRNLATDLREFAEQDYDEPV